jgi:CRP-like cAMP-binding protein
MLGIINILNIGLLFMQQTYSKTSILNIESPIKVISGHVLFRSINSNGSYISLGIWGAGDIIYPAKDWETSYELKMLSMTALENVVSSDIIPMESWERFNWYFQMSHQKSIRERMIALLEYLKVNFGTPYKDRVAIAFSMTHDDLATVVRSTRATVTNILKDIQKEGIIERRGKVIIL